MTSIATIDASDASFSEGRLVEVVQLLLLLASAAGYALASRRAGGLRCALVLAAGLACIGAIRELDSALDALLPIIGWQGPAALVLGLLVTFSYRQRDVLALSVGAMLRSPAGILAWTGFVSVVVFAQIAGQAEPWKAIMGESYNRDVKRTLEEMIEAFGYMQLLCSALEAWWAPLPTPKPAADQAEAVAAATSAT